MGKLEWVLIIILVIIIAMIVAQVTGIANITGYLGAVENPFKKIGQKIRDWRDERAQKAAVESKENVSKGFSLFNRAFNSFADGVAKFMLKEYCSTGMCDLDRMFKDKCSHNARGDDPEWAGSLFCALGEGNELASLIFRLRFAVPDSPEKHVLHQFVNESSKNLTGNVTADEQLHEFIKTIFAKINRRELLTWGDLPAYAIIAAKFPVIKDRYIEPAMNTYGLSLKKDPRARLGVDQTVKLNDLVVQKCGKKDADGKFTGPWQNTLFCSLASKERDHYMAEMLGRLKFTIPPEANKHILAQVVETVRKGLQTPPEGQSKQSWTNYGYEKAFNYQFSGIMNKINSNQPLSWDDMNNLFTFSLLGIKNFDLLWLAEPFVVPAAVQVGVDIAAKDNNLGD